jgi:hypothetical protein
MELEKWSIFIVNLLEKIAWPVTIIIVLIVFRKHIKALFDSVRSKIDNSKSLKISTSGLELEERVNVNEAKIEVMKNKLESTKSELIETPKNLTADLEGFYIIANEFQNLYEKDYALRVRKKQELGKKMGVYIINNTIPKSEILKNINEGALAGLAYSVLISPETGDDELLFSSYLKIKQKFTKYTYLTAFEELVIKNYLPKKNYSRLTEVLNAFASGADSPLIYKIEKLCAVTGC